VQHPTPRHYMTSNAPITTTDTLHLPPCTCHQSIWLHMSYKFYLELLRGGLYEEFFHEIKTGLVPFMDNAVYGRSPLEASSFIVSSAFPDKKMHGAGFQVARIHVSTTPYQPFCMSHVPCLLLEPQPLTHITTTHHMPTRRACPAPLRNS